MPKMNKKSMKTANFAFYGNQAILKSNGTINDHAPEIIKTALFREVLHRFLEELKNKESPFLQIFPSNLPEKKREDAIIELFYDLSHVPINPTVKTTPKFKEFFKNTYQLNQFVEELYNFWRDYERFFILSEDEDTSEFHKQPYKTFNESIETINHLVRQVYRDISQHITGLHFNVYRQMPAGFQVGLIISKENLGYTTGVYKKLKNIKIIKQVLIEPPLIIDPPTNTRKGEFKKVNTNPFEKIVFNDEEWMCYPARVGELLIYIYFHNKFIGLGTALANLFMLARETDFKRKPDAIYAFGVSEKSLTHYPDSKTVFYEDTKNDMLVGVVPDGNEYGYFGYLKKMTLTLHNIIMMKRGRMPIHGAMVKIDLKGGKSANVIILGDSGAGKSESLEAFRILGDKYIRDMKIIFDDMGSIEIDDDGNIRGYGTESGAFVRLDDLQPGFAFGNLDRSIIMSPQKINARAVLPITTSKEILYGYKIDYFMYANNYEEVDESHPIFEEFESVKEAIEVFRDGARMAKGTTNEKGIVHSYFANIFGPSQYKELHDKIATRYFNAMGKAGVKLGQLRTRLGIQGYEASGPQHAAEELFKMIEKS